MNNKPVTPQDILADGVDKTIIGGKEVRKGTVAAFLANIDIFESAHSSQEERDAALDALRTLAPDVKTIGLPRYVTFKNPLVEQLFL